MRDSEPAGRTNARHGDGRTRRMSFARLVSSLRDLAQAARSPGQAAARATRATDAAHANHNASESAAAAASAAGATMATSATMATAAAAATMAATATMATAATTACQLQGTAFIFPIEEMERRESNVGHFLFAENETLIGRGVVSLRDIGTGQGGCGCATDQ